MRAPRVVSLSLPAAGSGGLSAPLPCGKGLRAGISLAAAGDMALSRQDLLPHRARFIQSLGVPQDRVFSFKQVHSRRVIAIDSQDPASLAGTEADGMVTLRTDVLLTVTVGDCLPILLHDRGTGAFGLVHSGWKGTGIAADAVGLMAQVYGTHAEDLEVTIGPGIGACCYTVSEERAAGFAAEFGRGAVVRSSVAPAGGAPAGGAPAGGAPAGAGHQPRLDLRAANVTLLRAAGVEDITVVSDCTGCTPQLGSYRRQGPKDYTLMLAWVGGAGHAGPRADHPRSPRPPR